MSVLVTGASGFIGRHLVDALLQEGRETLCVASPARCGELAALVPRARWVPWDLADPGATPPLPARLDAVIHLAQSARYRDFPAAATEIFRVNCASTLQLLDHARKAGAGRFVLASSGSVYRRSGVPLREDAPVEPRSFYALSKQVAENVALPFRDFFDVVALRFFCVFGPGQRGRLISDLIERVCRGEPVALAGPGGLRINPLYVDDAVALVLEVLGTHGSGVFNVGGREALSLREIATMIGDIVGRAPSFTSTGDNEGDLVADISLVESTFGWRPRVPLADGLRRTVGAMGADSR